MDHQLFVLVAPATHSGSLRGWNLSWGAVTPSLVSLAYLGNMEFLFFLSTGPFWLVVERPLPSALKVVLLGETVPRMLPTQGCCHFH